MSTEMPAHQPSVKTYFMVAAALMFLLALTVGVSFFNLGPFNVVLSLGISILKALLIMMIFMEVRYSHPIVWLFAGASFLWLLIMLTLTISDYFTRGWVEPDWKDGTGATNHVEFVSPRH